MLNIKRKGKPINQIKNGKVIKMWNTMSEIAKHYDTVASTITHIVNNNKSYDGYCWEYA